MLFQKHFKIKTNIALRETKIRKLIDQLSQTFEIAGPDVDILFRNKTVSELKLSTHTRVDVLCYLFDGVPLVFELEHRLYPTVFLLNSLSASSTPLVFTHDEVLQRIQGGSDLMLPGVIKDGPLSTAFASLQKSDICGIVGISRKNEELLLTKVAAVGVVSMSPAEVNSSGGKGRFVSILHTSQDKLVEMCPPHLLATFNLNAKTVLSGVNVPANQENELSSEDPDNLRVDALDIEDAQGEQTPDELLMSGFLRGLTQLAPSDLPLPANVFYAKHMKSEGSPAANLEIKKTSYKKVGVFLEKMAAEGYIALEMVDPGILRLVSVTWEHPTLKDLIPDPSMEIRVGKNGVREELDPSKFCVGDFYFGPPVFEEVKILTSKIAPFFASSGYMCGGGIKQAEICRIVGAYIDSKNLRSDGDRNLINADALLMRVCDPMLLTDAPDSSLANPRFQITYQAIITSFTKGLKSSFRAVYPEKSGLKPALISGASYPKAKLTQAKQNGKDVTRIENLAIFGIDPKAFSRYIQTFLACSANLTENTAAAGTPTMVQAQGHHSIALSKLLTGTFGLSKNWIDGFTEPKKSKKKGGRK